MNSTAAPHHLTLNRIYGTPDLDGADISLIDWSPDSKLMTYVIGRPEGIQLMAVEAATGEKRVLFDWSRVLRQSPNLSARAKAAALRWDAEGETLPWRTKASTPLHALSLNYIWSPTGKLLLLAATGNGPYYLFDPASDTLSAPLPIDPAASDVDFSPDGRWLSYVLNYNLFILDIANGQSVPLTMWGTEPFRFATPDTLGDFLAEGYWWSPDAAKIACLVTDESLVPTFARQMLTSPVGAVDEERYPRPGDPNPHIGLTVITSHGHLWIPTSPWIGYYVARVQWLGDSTRLAIQFLSREQNHLVLAIADTATGLVTPVLEERSPDWINLSYDLTFLAGGNAFLWSSERDSWRHLYLYSIDGRQLAQLTSGDLASVDIKAVDETECAVYFRAYPAPYIDSQLMKATYRVDGAQVIAGAMETITRGPGTHAVTFSPDASHFAEQFSTVTTPPALNLYTREGKLVAAVEENIVPELAELLQPVEFPALLPAAKIGDPSDDMLLCHRVIRPLHMQEGHKYPAMVYLYGGPVPGGSARTVVNKWVHIPDLWAQLMATLGFVVYSLDNRGSCEAPRGHGFERAIWRRFGTVELADQLEGVKYLQGLPFVDASRIGVFGGSFGGFMALNCMLRAPEIFKTGVAFAPVTDWTGYDAIYTEQYMGQLAENAQGYAGSLLPPLAGSLKGKLLLIHGTADQNVHLHHSFNLVDALVAAGKQIEMMLYPGMTHADFFRISPQGRQLFERITKFFVEHL